MNIQRRLLALLLAVQILICNGGVTAVALDTAPLGLSSVIDTSEEKEPVIGTSDLPIGMSSLPPREVSTGMDYVWIDDESKENGGYYVLVPVFEPDDSDIVSSALTTWEEDLQEYLNPAPKPRRVRRSATLAANDVVITQLAADNHGLALDSKNKLYVWGDNTYGQLGLGDSAPTKLTSPKNVSFFNGKAPIKQIAAGKDVSYVLLVDGSIYEAGKGKTKTWTLNAELSSLGIYTIYTKESCDYALALSADDTLYYWGDIPGNVGYSGVTSTRPQLGNARIEEMLFSANFIRIVHTHTVSHPQLTSMGYSKYPYDGKLVTVCMNYTHLGELHQIWGNASGSTKYYCDNAFSVVNGEIGAKASSTDSFVFFAYGGGTGEDMDGDTYRTAGDSIVGNIIVKEYWGAGTPKLRYNDIFNGSYSLLLRDYFANVTGTIPTYNNSKTVTLGGKMARNGNAQGNVTVKYSATSPAMWLHYTNVTLYGAGNTIFVTSKVDDVVRAYEDNSYGKAGTGNNTTVFLSGSTEDNTIVQNITKSSLKEIVGGRDNTLFLKNDGSVMVAGNNAKGLLGQGDNYYEMSSNVPIPITFISSQPITISPMSNGQVNADKAEASEGEIVNVTVTPHTGFKLREGSLKYNGIPFQNSFVMPSVPVTITADFENIIYTVSTSPPLYGSISVNKVTAIYGEAVTVTPSPDIGYQLKVNGIKVNGSPISGTVFNMPADHVTVTSEFEPIVYNITIPSIPHGRVTASSRTAIMGEVITLTVLPDRGYRLKENSLSVNGTLVTANQFVMGASHVVISAEFEAIQYDVTVAPSTNGNLSVDKAKAIIGETVNVTISPDTGYKLKENTLKVNGRVITGNSFVMDAENTVISAEFEAIIYNISVATVPHGSIATDKATAIYGETVNITLTIDLGYQIKPGTLKVNGLAIQGTSFKMPANDAFISVEFEICIYDVLVAPTERAIITTDKSSAMFEELVKVTVVPIAGYQLKEGTLKVNGKQIVDYQFSMPASVATVTAEFEPIIYTITALETSNGRVTTDKKTAIIGETVKVTTNPDKGYKLVEGSIKVNGATSKPVFIMGAQNVEVSARFEAIIYNLKLEQSPHGTITANKTAAIIGETITLAIEPDVGYRIKPNSLMVDGKLITGNTFVMPASSATVTVEFEPVNLRGTVSDSIGNPLSGMTVTLQGIQTFTTTTNDVGEYSFQTIPNDHYTITATHYKWDTATAVFNIVDGSVDSVDQLHLICTRDNRLEVLEALIRMLPEPLENGSNDSIIKEKEGHIKHAKNLYDELDPHLRSQLDIVLKNKLEKLLIRLAVIESLVKSNVPGVTADGLEKVIDKSDIVSVDGEMADTIKVMLQVEKTDSPVTTDKEAIELVTGERDKVGDYMDINLYLQVDDKEPTKLTEINSPVSVSLPISKGISGKDYRVVRVHNGIAEYLEATANEGTITFSTDKFSTYALVFTPIYSSDDEDNEPSVKQPIIDPVVTKPVNPQTPPDEIKTEIDEPDIPTSTIPKTEQAEPKDRQEPVEQAGITTYVLPIIYSVVFLVLFILVMCAFCVYFAPIIKAKGERHAQRWLEREERKEAKKRLKYSNSTVVNVAVSEQVSNPIVRKKYRVIRKQVNSENSIKVIETVPYEANDILEQIQTNSLEKRTETAKKTLKDFIDETE